MPDISATTPKVSLFEFKSPDARHQVHPVTRSTGELQELPVRNYLHRNYLYRNYLYVKRGLRQA